MTDLLERLTTALGDRYSIEREVGRGGMAVVFLAEDMRHHRQVAIKVLHPDLTATIGAERFLHEIETVAGLQHPHILPLYDSGEADGLLYYVMPFAEGESLRQRIDREKQLAVDESVRIAVEVADGLDYAHQKGVVHRDIKPGNILLSARHAVIADFGIARAIEVARADRVTSTGLGVGTPLYASPEQATAQETLDGRTDIYSLGCVLYEMLAGEPPLTGATPQIIQARRVSETPTALHGLRDTVPPALDHVIARALARIPADRYATASQFGQALQAVLVAATPAAIAALSTTPGAPATTTTTTVAPERKRKVPRWVFFAVSTLVIAVVIAGAMLWFSSGRLGRGPLQFTASNITRVTGEPGWALQPAISPDGNEVAYVLSRLGGTHIVIRSTSDVGRGGEAHLAQELGGYHWLPAWKPDGASLRFLTCPIGMEGECDWMEVGRLGGSVMAVDRPSAGSAAWSRDGTRVAYVMEDSILVLSEADGEPELLGVHTVDPDVLHSLAWSPDGRWIAYVNGNERSRILTSTARSSIWALDAGGGEPVPVAHGEHVNVSPQWLDSRRLLFVSNREGTSGVYAVEVGSDGARATPRQVPGPAAPHSISVSANGRRLAYSSLEERQNIWSIPIQGSEAVSIRDAAPVTRQNRIIYDLGLSHDGGWIAFDTDLGGEYAIYKRRVMGGQPELVATRSSGASGPDWSPDGTEIAFSTRRFVGTDRGQIFVVPAGGGSPERVTDFPGYDHSPDWSPDGLAIAFASKPPPEGTPPNIWTVSRDNATRVWGEPVQLTDFGCDSPDWASDGSGVLCHESSGLTWGSRIMFVSREGEVLWRYDPSAEGLQYPTAPRFSPDGSRIYFWAAEDTASWGMWWIPAEGGPATKAVTFDDPLLLGGGYSVGTDAIYLTVQELEGDIWVMDLEW